MTVRAFYQVATINDAPSPYNTIHLKVFYPAQMSEDEPVHRQGIVPPNPQLAPFPVIILFNGVNCHPEKYNWIAKILAKRGLVIVTFAWIAENFPGVVALTPGVDIASLSPDNYGKTPTASALSSLLAELERINEIGLLAGMLDLNKIVLGGHSAGGRVAVESANPRFFSQIVASFGYGVHSAAGTMLGYEPATILPLPDALPLLLMGGTCDGVIANSANIYNTNWKKPTTPISRTFTEAISGGRNDSYLLLIEGANHFIFTDPFDTTTGRPFLDFSVTQSADDLRSFIAEMIGLFLDAYVHHQSSAKASLNQYIDKKHPLIAEMKCK